MPGTAYAFAQPGPHRELEVIADARERLTRRRERALHARPPASRASGSPAGPYLERAAPMPRPAAHHSTPRRPPSGCRYLPCLQARMVPYELHLFAEREDAPASRVGELILKAADQCATPLVVLAAHNKVPPPARLPMAAAPQQAALPARAPLALAQLADPAALVSGLAPAADVLDAGVRCVGVRRRREAGVCCGLHHQGVQEAASHHPPQLILGRRQRQVPGLFGEQRAGSWASAHSWQCRPPSPATTPERQGAAGWAAVVEHCVALGSAVRSVVVAQEAQSSGAQARADGSACLMRWWLITGGRAACSPSSARAPSSLAPRRLSCRGHTSPPAEVTLPPVA